MKYMMYVQTVQVLFPGALLEESVKWWSLQNA